MVPPKSTRYSDVAMFTRLATTACGVLIVVLAAVPQSQSPAAKAFTGVRLIDGTGRAAVENATIVVQNGRITAAGPAASVSVPQGAERIALAGKTVIPGFINAHGHVNDATRDLRVYAAYGVTTVVSLGGELEPVFAARASQNTSALNRARVYLAGPVLAPTTVEDARKGVADLAAQQVDFVKIRVDDNLGTVAKMPPEVYHAVIDEAHRRKMRVAAHLFYLADAKGLLDAGVDLVAHSVRDLPVDADVIGKLRSRNICVVPTLMREVSTFVYESTPDFFADALFTAQADAQLVKELRDPAEQAKVKVDSAAQRYKTALEVASRNVKALHDAGVVIAMGTDTGPRGRFQGYFELMELELMVKAGLTPAQAIAAATRNAARCTGLDASLGTIESGRWADFIALDADPLANISNVRRIDSVWIAGNRVPR